MPQAPKNLNDFKALLEVVKILRGPEGCPWDKEQTAQTLAPYAIEECYELAEAIEEGQSPAIKEELGDVLFQVALQSQVAQEAGDFSFEDVVEFVNQKMIRRHPHVFGDVNVSGIDEIWQNWEKIKAEEKKAKADENDSPFSSIPRSLPSLQRAYKIGVKADKMKFDWDHWSEVLAKVEEEFAELKAELHELQKLESTSPHAAKAPQVTSSLPPQALKTPEAALLHEKIEHEMGDLIFSLSHLARRLEIEPEQALRKTNKRFEERFVEMQKLITADGLTWENMTTPQKEEYWQKAKLRLSVKK